MSKIKVDEVTNRADDDLPKILHMGNDAVYGTDSSGDPKAYSKADLRTFVYPTEVSQGVSGNVSVDVSNVGLLRLAIEDSSASAGTVTLTNLSALQQSQIVIIIQGEQIVNPTFALTLAITDGAIYGPHANSGGEAGFAVEQDQIIVLRGVTFTYDPSVTVDLHLT
jgi:hypothetical protein